MNLGMRAKRIVLTGASGYVGSRLIPLLLNDPDVDHVVGIDQGECRIRSHPKWTFVQKDIRDPEIRSLFLEADCMVHLAFVVKNIHDDAQAKEINLRGADNLLEACRSAPVRRIVFISSAAVYGYGPRPPAGVSEDAPIRPDPTHVYSISKALVERKLQTFQKEHPETGLCILRPTLVVGPGVNNSLANLFRKNTLVGVLGYNPQVQAVEIQDMIHALHAAIKRNETGVFNVGPVDAVSVSEICRRFSIRVLKVP